MGLLSKGYYFLDILYFRFYFVKRMRNYKFKKDFFGQWMKKKGLTSYAMMDILGLKSTNHIDVWAGIKPPRDVQSPKEDQGWLPLVHILKICNRFPDEVSLSDFIENAEEPRQRKRQTKSDTETLAAVKEAYQAALDAKEGALAAKDETIAAQRETIAALQTALGRKGGATAFAGEKTTAV